MLEYNFDLLDNDFITLWSNYLLYNDANAIIKPLRILAEKGQINAVQSWYLLKKEDEHSEKIDKIVDLYRGHSFNETLAIANRTYSKTKQDIMDKLEEILVTQEKIDKYDEEMDDLYGLEYDYDDNPYLDDLRRLDKELKEMDFVKQVVTATERTVDIAKSTMSPLIFERVLELYKSCKIFLNQDDVSRGDYNFIRKSLLKEYKKAENNVDSVKFALAKNLVFFSDKRKHKIMGTQMLKELSERSLSSDLQLALEDNSQDEK